MLMYYGAKEHLTAANSCSAGASTVRTDKSTHERTYRWTNRGVNYIPDVDYRQFVIIRMPEAKNVIFPLINHVIN